MNMRCSVLYVVSKDTYFFDKMEWLKVDKMKQQSVQKYENGHIAFSKSKRSGKC
jgi:hypothetical protein